MTKPKNQAFVKKSEKKTTQKTNHIKLGNKAETENTKNNLENKMAYY